MIQITPQMRVLVAVEAIDFRRGMDGLAQVCRESLGADPATRSGTSAPGTPKISFLASAKRFQSAVCHGRF